MVNLYTQERACYVCGMLLRFMLVVCSPVRPSMIRPGTCSWVASGPRSATPTEPGLLQHQRAGTCVLRTLDHVITRRGLLLGTGGLTLGLAGCGTLFSDDPESGGWSSPTCVAHAPQRR